MNINPPDSSSSPSDLNTFREVPKTGVIYVTSEAAKCGFSDHDETWANFGQGAPEVGPFKNESERSSLTISNSGDEYTPIAGLLELRQVIANLYNELFRKNKKSKYSAENVAIAGGGRTGLTRVVTTLGNINIGHMIPDYTAYEELLSVFKEISPIPLLLDEKEGYKLSASKLEAYIQKLGLSAILVSNPCNPTGQTIRGKELKKLVGVAKEEKCTLILDEFYSHYIYSTDISEKINIVSAARYVEDVNKDPAIILDGLTKNWRRPGWRISWTLAPKDIIERIASAGSFLDGGASHPLQISALPLLNPKEVRARAENLQKEFRKKRNYMLKRLRAMNIQVPHPSQGSFYFWAKLDRLPKPLRDGMSLFKAGLEEKVITVPGEFFDVNPGKRRKSAAYKNYARISFGPKMETLKIGLDALERIINKKR